MTPTVELPPVAAVLQIFVIDLLMSGDNAVVVALASRGLPGFQRRAAVTLGIAIAILLRIALTSVATITLQLPGFELVGGILLLMIATRLAARDEPIRLRREGSAAGHGRSSLAAAIAVIVVADLIMSFDNVVAIAAMARGNILLLSLGLLLSIPFLVWGASLAITLLRRYRPLVIAGGALLGWIAGDIAISDPLIVDWINSQAPALPYAVPTLAVLLVLAETLWAETPKSALGAPQPAVDGARTQRAACGGASAVARQQRWLDRVVAPRLVADAGKGVADEHGSVE
jgi:YjbE family integral membrane protein